MIEKQLANADELPPRRAAQLREQRARLLAEVEEVTGRLAALKNEMAHRKHKAHGRQRRHRRADRKDRRARDPKDTDF